jgi:hypothetical protein
MIAYYLYDKDFDQCTNEERSQVFRAANTSFDQLDKQVSSHQINVRGGNSKVRQMPHIGRDGLPKHPSQLHRAQQFKEMVSKAKHYAGGQKRQNTLDKYLLAKLYQMKSPRAPDKQKLRAGLKKNSVQVSNTRDLEQTVFLSPNQVVMPKNQRRSNMLEEYNYNSGGCWEMAYRIPENLFGTSLKHAARQTASVNIKMADE